MKISSSCKEMMMVAIYQLWSAHQLEIGFLEPFNKSLSHLLYCQVIFQSMSTCSFETRSIPFHNTPLGLIRTSINCNGLRHLQYIISAQFCQTSSALYGFNVINTFCCQWQLHHNFTQCVCTGQMSIGHSPSVYIIFLIQLINTFVYCFCIIAL